MNTNIVTLEESHTIMKEDYIKENEVNRYFGQIMVYNFMADSLKHNRIIMNTKRRVNFFFLLLHLT